MPEEPKQAEEKLVEEMPSPEVWETTYQRARQLLVEIVNELNKTGNQYNEWSRVMDGVNNPGGEPCDRSVLVKYAAWHGACGSSGIEQKDVPYADLPDEKSIIKYLESVLSELKERNQDVQK